MYNIITLSRIGRTCVCAGGPAPEADSAGPREARDREEVRTREAIESPRLMFSARGRAACRACGRYGTREAVETLAMCLRNPVGARGRAARRARAGRV